MLTNLIIDLAQACDLFYIGLNYLMMVCGKCNDTDVTQHAIAQAQKLLHIRSSPCNGVLCDSMQRHK